MNKETRDALMGILTVLEVLVINAEVDKGVRKDLEMHLRFVARAIAKGGVNE